MVTELYAMPIIKFCFKKLRFNYNYNFVSSSFHPIVLGDKMAFI